MVKVLLEFCETVELVVAVIYVERELALSVTLEELLYNVAMELIYMKKKIIRQKWKNSLFYL
jgi:hypothetical protein